MRPRTLTRYITTLLLSSVLLFLGSGCHELSGPTWSPDGQLIAVTYYTFAQKPVGRLDTTIHVFSPDDDGSDPLYTVDGAAFPHWGPDGPTLYFLGKRDSEGFYGSVYSYKYAPRAEGAPAIAPTQEIGGLKLSGFQVSVDGSAGLLFYGKDIRPGAPGIVEFWDVHANKRNSLRDLGEVSSPALGFNGHWLAFSQTPQNSKPIVAVLDLDRLPLTPKAVFPTPELDEANAPSYTVYTLPDNDRVFFYAPNGRSVWTVRRDGTRVQRYPLPENCSAPAMVSFSLDSRFAYLTLAQAANGHLSYTHYELALERAAWRSIESAPTLCGGLTFDPQGLQHKDPRKAWLSPAGLALNDGGKTRYFPRSAEQYLAASKLYLEDKDAAKAAACAERSRELKPPVELLREIELADARALLADQKGRQALDVYIRASLLFPLGPEPLTFIFPPNGPLPSPPAALIQDQIKELDAFIAGAPQGAQEALVLQSLRDGLQRRLKGDQAAAIEGYRGAEALCASEDLKGGLRFLQGMAEFEQGNIAAAAERWETAARSNDFAQAGYVAGLAAETWYLDGRPESDAKGNQALQRAQTLLPNLGPELQTLTALIKGKPAKSVKLSDEIKSPDQKVHAWVEVTELLVPQASLLPQRMLTPDRKYSDRYIGVALATSSALQLGGTGVAEGTRTLVRIPRPISLPNFTPAGDMIGFLAQGEVFPLADAFCEAYVVDLNKNLLAGDPGALTGGPLRGRAMLSSLTWAGPRDLRADGVQVDYLGGQTPVQKVVSIGGGK